VSGGYTGLDISLTGSGIAWFAGAPGDTVMTTLVGEKGITVLPLLARWWALEALSAKIRMAVPLDSDVFVESLDSVGRSGRMNSGTNERAWLWLDVVGRLLDAGHDVTEVNASTLKLFATGKGGASKLAVMEACTRRFPEFVTEGDDNMCDASVAAVLGSFLAGNQLPSWKLPASHMKALDKLRVVTL
jgi:hypothetical protein